MATFPNPPRPRPRHAAPRVRLTRRGRTAVATLAVGTALAVGFLTAPATSPALPSSNPATCTTWDIGPGDAAYEFGLTLQADGWYGVPGDGAERLYSPSCR